MLGTPTLQGRRGNGDLQCADKWPEGTIVS